MNRIKLKIISAIMKPYGIPANMTYKLYLRIVKDLNYNKDSSFKGKLWCYKRGFLVSSAKAYGLTEQNYKHYLNDIDFYRLYPIDKHFRYWIDDKLTMKYILSPFNDYLPKYFCIINLGGIIIPLIDGKDILNTDDLLSCIKRERQVAVKLISSAHGVGFYKISYNDRYEINNRVVTDDQFVEFLRTLDGYLVTEYVVAHEEIRKISSGALNTVRIMVINEDSKHPKLANSVMKFSTKASGMVDNTHAGSVFAIVNVSTGEFSDAKNVVNSVYLDCKTHPDSKMEIKGILPYWRELSEKLIEISQYLTPLTYLGYDIAITDDSFRIIEINSHQGIRMFQSYGPILKDNIAADFFNKALKNKKR